MIASAFAGFLAGTIHVLSGPDHLAAVAPLAMRRPWRAWLHGMQWGVGHVVGIAVIASLAWVFRDLLPLERISGFSEQLVGVVLIAVGLWALRAAFRNRLHAHEHQHDGSKHLHVHAHADTATQEHPGAAHDHSHAPLWIGVLHGAAGSAHLLAILPALAFPTRAQSSAYLLGYAVGTVVAMVCFTTALGRLSLRVHDSRLLYRSLNASVGVVAVVVGGIWLAGLSV